MASSMMDSGLMSPTNRAWGYSSWRSAGTATPARSDSPSKCDAAVEASSSISTGAEERTWLGVEMGLSRIGPVVPSVRRGRLRSLKCPPAISAPSPWLHFFFFCRQARQACCTCFRFTGSPTASLATNRRRLPGGAGLKVASCLLSVPPACCPDICWISGAPKRMPRLGVDRTRNSASHAPILRVWGGRKKDPTTTPTLKMLKSSLVRLQ